MKARTAIEVIQSTLGIPQELRAPTIGPKTRARFEYLASLGPDDDVKPYDAPGIQIGDRQINKAGLDLVKHFEGCQLDAYEDEAGVWTIGWGHTGLQHNDGTVYRGRVISQEKADELLAYDMHQFEQRVMTLVATPLTDDQFSALVAFDFNTGGLTVTDLKGKSVASKLLRELNSGDIMGAADEFPTWVHVNGRVVNGLVRRRYSERQLFLHCKPVILETMADVDKVRYPQSPTVKV